MPNGYQIFKNFHPVGGLYRYKVPAWQPRHASWEHGKVYLLTRWERPEGIDKKSPLVNAFFFVGGQEICVDISFFKYLEMVE